MGEKITQINSEKLKLDVWAVFFLALNFFKKKNQALQTFLPVSLTKAQLKTYLAFHTYF